MSSSVPCAPSMVAFTVERIFSWVPMVGMRSHTWSRFVLILLSVHSLASSLASLVTSSEDSAMALAMEISSLLLPLSSWTNCDSLAMSKAIFLAAAMMSLSLLLHCLTSWCSSCAAIMMGPWLGVGACSNMLSASSSVSGGGGRGGARLPYCPPPLGGGGRGGASPCIELFVDFKVLRPSGVFSVLWNPWLFLFWMPLYMSIRDSSSASKPVVISIIWLSRSIRLSRVYLCPPRFELAADLMEFFRFISSTLSFFISFFVFLFFTKFSASVTMKSLAA